MKIIRMPRLNEQRKVELLLAKLERLKAATKKSAPITSTIRTA
jgi:hypothetical protein